MIIIKFIWNPIWFFLLCLSALFLFPSDWMIDGNTKYADGNGYNLNRTMVTLKMYWYRNKL